MCVQWEILHIKENHIKFWNPLHNEYSILNIFYQKDNYYYNLAYLSWRACYYKCRYFKFICVHGTNAKSCSSVGCLKRKFIFIYNSHLLHRVVYEIAKKPGVIEIKTCSKIPQTHFLPGKGITCRNCA